MQLFIRLLLNLKISNLVNNAIFFVLTLILKRGGRRVRFVKKPKKCQMPNDRTYLYKRVIHIIKYFLIKMPFW